MMARTAKLISCFDVTRCPNITNSYVINLRVDMARFTFLFCSMLNMCYVFNSIVLIDIIQK